MEINNSIKVAYINLTTGVVENIIMVKSIKDPVPENYKIVAIPVTQTDIKYPEEEKNLYEVLAIIDPAFVPPPKYRIDERPVYINKTKWSVELGFYEPEE